MGIFSIFRSRQDDKSANTAKERLQVIIAHERVSRSGPDYLPRLKADILEVIQKYVDIGDDHVKLQLDTQADCDVLELNITLPEGEDDEKNQKRRARVRASAAGKIATGNVG